MKKTEKMSVERLILIGFGVTLAALILIGGTAWNIAVPFTPFQTVDHTGKVLAELSDIQFRLDNIDRAQWSFFLTNEDDFLKERDTALSELAKDFAQLKILTHNNQTQQTRLLELQAVLSKRISLLHESKNIFESQGLNAIRPLFKLGRQESTHARAIIFAATQAEQALLESRKLNAAIQIKTIVASVVLLLIFLALWSVRLRRATLGRRADEQASQVVREVLLKMGALQDAIFNNPNFSIIATDAQGMIQIFNVGAEHMLGYQAADIVNNMTPADISDKQEIITRATNLSLEFNTPISNGFDALVFKASRNIEDIYELTYLRKDGSRLPAVVSVTALRDTQEKIIGYLVIGTDNTTRKQAEAEQALLDQRLRDQQFYTRSLIESNIDALITTDLHGIISDVNQQMEALTGCTRDELIGAPFKNYFTDQARAELAIKHVLSAGKVRNYELTVSGRDGKETVVSYNASTIYDRDRQLQGVFASARDVTDRKQFELTLQENNLELEQAKATAEKANLAKSEFLSSMSHELRTPLNAVLGFAQLMASDQPPPSATQKMSIDQILQAGWYLLRLINEILDLALIESGKLSMSQEAILLHELLQDCQAMIEPQADKRELSMHFPSMDIPLYVHADRTRLKQIMINLLSNAIKYNRPGGSVSVEYAMTGENRVRISVKDAGAGMTPEQVTQLFQPFNRLGQEAGKEEGTGIGLVVTKQLVELMGGIIGVESRVGVGSVFWIELTVSAAPGLACGDDDTGRYAENMATSATTAKAIAPRTLLYVEDNPANLALVEQLIARRNDLTLLTAIDAHRGIKLARSEQPDIILMDINLPGLSGFGALELLQNDPLTKHIPVMALTANAVPRDIEKGLQAGFFRYLTKPIKVNEFMDALDVALQHAKDQGYASHL
ncbi:hypothetical protein BH11PSE12_BH11PSE12_00450 [soil metagenome]